MDMGKKFLNELENFMKDFFGNNYEEMIAPEHKGKTLEDMFKENEQEIRDVFYGHMLSETTEDNSDVQKTLAHYLPTIIYNKSNIHFLLHNSYGTLRYLTPKAQKQITEFDWPTIMIEPISSNLCFYLVLCEEEIDITQTNYEIPIIVFDKDEQVKEMFIEGYVQPSAKNYIVDDTNIKLLDKLFTEQKEGK